ncbi:alpha-1,2-fucosyltransferase [Fibrella forsythiae]|uniref:Alpha-1,2-fucosyltransferase n=1 Tax=Fibrella forsythiae TaxID=2817061 RepID=A0ABS3JPC4_9BACT|nr:alpha-1,2-fucosyltransferase [Fibrella forsythiae]MBO0951850.1 alpha-1,2-fucosyltransferase [Fibrella forsythiae]
MIVSSITSGLGNQLFQYAFGRALSLYHSVPLKTDLYWFQHEQNTSHRKYGLTHFNIQAPEATWQELDTYIFADTKWHRLTRPYYKRIRIEERSNKYDANVWKFPKHTYVLGFWQAWRYFADYHAPIREEFQIITPPSDQAARYLDQMSRGTSVSVHIRRGDYLTNPTFNTLTPEYYQRAISYLQERYESLNWFVFSDDMPWVQENITLPESTTLVKGLSDIDDFRLMNAARHSIIANSTFSWWAAWLKETGDHVIVAPQTPFTHEWLWSGDDLFPPHFVRL